MKKGLKIFLIVIVVILVGIQLIPLDRSNPPVTMDIPAPPEVRTILKKSCYDCHSNESNWPWYAYVAPASWLVVYDVHEAREHLNFSEWDQLGSGMRTEMIEETWHEIDKGEMPLWQYTLIHRDAVLTDDEKATIRNWSMAETGANEDTTEGGEDNSGEHEGHEHEDGEGG